MKVLYAPSSREFSDDLHGNVACGFDCMVLGTLVELKNLEILYLPHKNTSSRIVESLRNTFGSSITFVDSMPSDFDCLVSDMSNIIFQHVFYKKSPSILCLFGFNGIEFPSEDTYYSLVKKVSHCVHSLKELKEAILSFSAIKTQKEEEIQGLLEGNLL